MARRDERVDQYIAKSAAFARPILRHLRQVVHAGCPAVEETLKWGFPHFLHKGILCSMAAFTHHCAFGFWKGALLVDGRDGAAPPSQEAMGQFGRITAIRDLPPRATLLKLVRKAVRLNDDGVKVRRRTAPPAGRRVHVPTDLMRALRGNARALATYRGFSYSHRKDYVEWVTEARRDETRRRRIETAVAWMAEGKTRNWKYERR